jgi:hypothetical protein
MNCNREPRLIGLMEANAERNAAAMVSEGGGRGGSVSTHLLDWGNVAQITELAQLGSFDFIVSLTLTVAFSFF